MFDINAVRRALNQNLDTPPGDDQTKKMLWNLSKALVLIAEGMYVLDHDLGDIRSQVHGLKSQASASSTQPTGFSA